MTTAGGWTETTDVPPGYLDANGWPVVVPDAEGAQWVTRIAFGRALPPGDYILDWQGSGDFTTYREVTASAPGRMTIRLGTTADGTTEPLQLHVFASDAEDPLRNIRIYRAEDAALVEAGEVWRPSYLDQVGQFRMIRVMDLQGTNSSEVAEWDAGREGMDRASWSGSAPLAAAVDLANAVNADLWVNIPHLASDAYIRTMAATIASTLDPELRVIVEYSNEHWVPVFGQHDWFTAQGQALLGPEAAFPASQFYAWRAPEAMAVFAEAFGNDARLDRALTVSGGYIQWDQFRDAMFDAPALEAAGLPGPDEDRGITMLAVDTYFSGGVGWSQNEAQIMDWIAQYGTAGARDRAFAAIEAGTGFVFDYTWDDLGNGFSEAAAVARANGWRLVSYEGGTHFTAEGGSDPAYVEFMMSMNGDPRIVGFTQKIFDLFIAAGGEIMGYFADTGADGYFGNWSSWDDGFALGPNPRGQAAVDQNAQAPWFSDPREAAIFVDDRLRDPNPTGGAGDHLIFGTPGDDLLRGRRGADTLVGGAGDDRLRGQAGDDVLLAGAGRDRMAGGAGADRFVFLWAEGRARIADFDPQEDVIDLRALALSAPVAWGVAPNGDAVLDLDGYHLRVVGQMPADLTEALLI